MFFFFPPSTQLHFVQCFAFILEFGLLDYVVDVFLSTLVLFISALEFAIIQLFDRFFNIFTHPRLAIMIEPDCLGSTIGLDCEVNVKVMIV